jgi:hypothetical protein
MWHLFKSKKREGEPKVNIKAVWRVFRTHVRTNNLTGMRNTAMLVRREDEPAHLKMLYITIRLIRKWFGEKCGLFNCKEVMLKELKITALKLPISDLRRNDLLMEIAAGYTEMGFYSEAAKALLLLQDREERNLKAQELISLVLTMGDIRTARYLACKLPRRIRNFWLKDNRIGRLRPWWLTLSYKVNGKGSVPTGIDPKLAAAQQAARDVLGTVDRSIDPKTRAEEVVAGTEEAYKNLEAAVVKRQEEKVVQTEEKKK